MKRGTTPTLRISVGIESSLISEIEFLFKLYPSEEAPEIVRKAYPGDVTYDSVNDLFLLPLTESETRMFGNNKVYLDARILTTGGKIPNTKIVTLSMTDTLFGEEDDND